MLENNCRVESSKGIKFYEQDILFDNYKFNGNFQITIKANYTNPGLGIALIDSEGLSLDEKKELYLFKIGKDVSILHRTEDETKRILRNSMHIAIPNENLTFKLKKIGKVISVDITNIINGVPKTVHLYDFVLPKRMDFFQYGIYSNAGNTIESVSIASLVPDKWNINMDNADGGYISFFDDGFKIENCNNNAEVEQIGIELKAGKYFLKYNKNKDCDLDCFVFLSDDQRNIDEEKSILNPDGSIVLDNPTSVNIKFVGTIGEISNIQLAESKNEIYVSSRGSSVTRDASYIKLIMKKQGYPSIKEVSWNAKIHSTPNPLSDLDKDKFYLIKDSMEEFTPQKLNILPNIDYRYELIADENYKNYMLNIYQDKHLVGEHLFRGVYDFVYLFFNMDVTITNMKIIDMYNKETIITLQKNTRETVSNTIESPILCTYKKNGMDYPLDLSSSYRIFNNGKYDEYIFTNKEREVFSVQKRLRLENLMSEDTTSVKIYAIKNDIKFNLDNLYRLKNKDIDNIDAMTEHYVILDKSYIKSIDANSNEIVFNELSLDDYSTLIVDYNKKDSYCINENFKKGVYEIDICSEKNNVGLIYDNIVTDNVSIISSYKQTNATFNEDSYIVLRRGE